ncbi:hypothetical protein ACN1C3_06665 [Pseudomonas sp. H11T01]|uniref:hypothetical protein n=1 Tax=Pseudomonas sp. H11T01 TaxID=3402749 RepID=UPI003ACF7DFB
MGNWVFIVFCLSALALVLLGLGVSLYMVFFKMEKILKCLDRCQGINVLKSMMRNTPQGRFYILNTVSSILSNPSIYLQDGRADPEDIENFPENLRRWIKIADQLTFIGGVGFFALFFIMVLFGWKPSSTTQAEWMLIKGMALCLGLMVLCACVYMYVAFFKIDEIEKNLSRCLFISRHQQFTGNGLRGRVNRLTTISGALHSPKNVRVGDVNQDDIDNFPPHLRRWIRLPLITFMALGLVLLVLAIAHKSLD